MNRFLLALLISAATINAWASDIVHADRAIGQHYIVVLQDSTEQASKLETGPADRGQDHARNRRQVHDLARSIGGEFGGQLGPIYTDSIRGFAVRMNRRQAHAMAGDPRVAYVTEDSWVSGAVHDTQFDPPSWGLDRIDQREAMLDGLYQHLSYWGETPVHVYVIDSGIHYTHEDFEGRVDNDNAFNAYTDGHGVDGCHGHGTHVAGIIGGQLHGVAKNVILHPVRVLNCWNAAPLSAVIAGVDWVTARMLDQPHAAVANMSLLASASTVLDDAVRASIAAGVTYVVAAGNNAADACNYSPARVAEAITVGSSNASDSRAASSNHGACVDIYAPGVSITSTFNRSNSDTLTMSGTSMASPHVAGIAAKLLAQAPQSSPSEIASLIMAHATQVEPVFDPFGNDLLAFALIELEDANEPEPDFGLSFSSSCNPRGRHCAFEASVDDKQSVVSRYFWDFGDGNSTDHHRPFARNRYIRSSGTVTVLLGVLLSNGDYHLVDQVVELPF